MFLSDMSNSIVSFRFIYRAITTLTTLMMTRKVLMTTLTALMIAMMVLMILENLNWRSTKNILVLTTLKFLLTVIPTLFRYSEIPYVLILWKYVRVHPCTTFAHLCDSQVAVHKLLSPYSYQFVFNTSVVNSFSIILYFVFVEPILMNYRKVAKLSTAD